MKRILFIIVIMFLITGCGIKDNNNTDNSNGEVSQEETSAGYIEGELEIKDIDGKNYEFIYRDEVYKVLYVSDTWKIYDSYKITNNSDMKKICRALLKIHKIPSSDYKSYRNVDDMVYEWKQHNLAFQVLPEGNLFRESAKDVDLDPRDQGKSLVEIYEDRTGQKLDLSKLFG